MRWELDTQKQTHNNFEVSLLFVDQESDHKIYANLYGAYTSDLKGSFASQVKLWLFGNKVEDTGIREGVDLNELIQEVVKRHNLDEGLERVNYEQNLT